MLQNLQELKKRLRSIRSKLDSYHALPPVSIVLYQIALCWSRSRLGLAVCFDLNVSLQLETIVTGSPIFRIPAAMLVLHTLQIMYYIWCHKNCKQVSK